MRTVSDDQSAIQYIIDLIYERSRIRLHEGKEPLIRARLGKRMRLHGYGSLGEYCAFLQHGADEDEIGHVVDALTTNFTHFLREEDQLRFLVEKALPSRPGHATRRFSIWSAGCATGEEPYSMTFFLDEFFPLSQGWNWNILATDISTRALKTAETGVYAAEKLKSLSDAWVRKYFQKGHGASEGLFRVKPYLRDRIHFRQENLTGEHPGSDLFDVIFCRNVMIYFDRQTQHKLVNHLCRYLAPQGYLLIGHSESLTGVTAPLRCLRPSFFQKT